MYLRPTDGPLLNAPKNSTQFIIDDHENSNLFFNFDSGAASKSESAIASSSARSPDDDTFWAEFSERDFQSVYESAHQEEVSRWDRQKLCCEITAMERRQKELVNILSRLDPEMYLRKLQAKLMSLQDTNRSLKEENKKLGPDLPDSTVGSNGDLDDDLDVAGHPSEQAGDTCSSPRALQS